eukprot:16431023-Heterocapsa_arctica.AAC.1
MRTLPAYAYNAMPCLHCPHVRMPRVCHAYIAMHVRTMPCHAYNAMRTMPCHAYNAMPCVQCHAMRTLPAYAYVCHAYIARMCVCRAYAMRTMPAAGLPAGPAVPLSSFSVMATPTPSVAAS